MKITLVITSLSSGGAERVLVLMAKGLLNQGHEVSVVTIYSSDFDFYPLPKGVKRESLGLGGASGSFQEAMSNNYKLIRGLRKAVLELSPDLVISFMDRTNVITLMSLINTKIPVIVTEHNDPIKLPIGRAWSLMRRMIYPFASKVVSVSQGVDKFFTWISSEKRAVIYNPLPLEDLVSEEGEILNLNSPFTLVSMGRLNRQKGYDLLLKAFAIVKERFPDWQLVVLGEGEERGNLEREIVELDLTDRVKLPGRLKNPFPTLKKADLFVLSSRFEGFGNVIIEAMACGLPVISTDCPSGPGEIIQNGENGILVEPENVNALVSGLEILMASRKKREMLAKNGLVSVERFSLDNIMKQWEQITRESVSRIT